MPTAHQPEEIVRDFTESVHCEAQSVIAVDEVLQLPAQSWTIGFVPDDTETAHAVDERVEIAANDSEEGVQEFAPLSGIESPDHAEVVHDETAVRQNSEIPRMWISVEEPVHKHAFQDESSGTSSERCAIDGCPIEFVDPVDRNPVNAAHRQHVFRRAVPEDPWDDDVRTVSQQLSETIGIAPFPAVIQFATDGPGELFDEANEVVGSGERTPAVGNFCDFAQNRKVFLDRFGDARLANLDDDRRSGRQRRGVYLTDRGGSQRNRIEPGIEFFERTAEAPLDLRDDRLGRNRRDAITKQGELLDIAGWDEIVPRRENLAQFNERWAEFLQCHTKPHRGGDLRGW
ncbi:hypothetical protein HRbin27_01986 [bacterium HR27]|nr:hypothetical protein HRbin27_01986 [bacterium HR27]